VLGRTGLQSQTDVAGESFRSRVRWVSDSMTKDKDSVIALKGRGFKPRRQMPGGLAALAAEGRRG
jgi:hypothetical protein